MRAKELRIGNWVSFIDEHQNEEHHQITGIRQDLDNKVMLDVDEFYQWEDIDLFKPIPLTEEWLEKFGFETSTWDDNSSYRMPLDDRGEFTLVFWRLDKTFEIGDVELCNILYVHQLQNLYFALTSQELELKE